MGIDKRAEAGRQRAAVGLIEVPHTALEGADQGGSNGFPLGGRERADEAALAVLVAIGATVAVRVVQRVAREHVAGLERARLAGVQLAARTAQHELNNSLALTLGNAEMLAEHPDLPTDLRVLADQSLRGAQLAAEAVDRLVAWIGCASAIGGRSSGRRSIWVGARTRSVGGLGRKCRPELPGTPSP